MLNGTSRRQLIENRPSFAVFIAQCHWGRVQRLRFSFGLDDLSLFHRFEVKQDSDDEEKRKMVKREGGCTSGFYFAVCRSGLPLFLII